MVSLKHLLTIFILIFVNVFLLCANQIGTLYVGSGANIRYFTSKPGSRGIPNTIVKAIDNNIPVYEIFDWRKIDPRLTGNGHTWYKVDASNSYWIYGATNFQYISIQEMEYIINDYAFTNQKFTLEQCYSFFHSFTNNKFTKNQIKYIYEKCREYNINILIAAVKMQQESSIVENNYVDDYDKQLSRCMGACLYRKNPDPSKPHPYLGFEKQIDTGLAILNRHFKDYKAGRKIELLQNQGVIVPKNAATYSLYVYAPIYGYYWNYGTLCTGNITFAPKYKKFVKHWRDSLDKNK